MTTENPTDLSQQPNSGEAVENADAAKPDGEAATEPNPPGGQGNGDNAAAGDPKGEGDGQKPEETTGAPETYEPYTLPEGFTLEGERLEKANAYFRSKNYSQADAQEAINLFCEFTAVDGEAASEAVSALVKDGIESARVQQTTEWGVQAKNEFGDRYDAVLGDALYSVNALVAERPSLKETFNKLGWGNHPDLIWAFHKFGASLKESDIDTGNTRGHAENAPKSLEERMYGGGNAKT